LDCDPTDAGYDYLLKLARVRFLLANDAGVGKTIMAGLLVRELKLRGLVERVLVLCSANLTFQWQRELKEKFDEKFIVLNPNSFRSRHQTVGQQGAALSAGRRRPLALPHQSALFYRPRMNKEQQQASTEPSAFDNRLLALN
jgi:SNF2 family DNA or RNA helicase